MPQRFTDTDKVREVGLLRDSDVDVRLTAVRQRRESFDELVLWKSLASSSREHGGRLAVSVAYHPTPNGPADATVFAAVDGIGVRWALTPAGADPPRAYAAEGVEVFALDGSPPGQALLSRLGLGRVHRALQAALDTPAAASVLGERWGAVVAPKPGRRGRPDLFYARVALDYVRALEVEPGAPVRRLLADADERGEHLSPDEVRARLRRARERGLLTAAPPGRAGGELTGEAKQLLREVGLIEGDDDGER